MREALLKDGLFTMTVPEAATLIFGNGFDPRGKMNDGGAFLQGQLIRLQIALEDQWKDLVSASGAEEGVLLCDRGTMDGPAWTTEAAWKRILLTHDWNERDLYGRYTGVIHLVTAAAGAEAFYGNANNPARNEDPVHARNIDIILQKAWSGHHNFRVVDNSYPSFDAKIEAAIDVARSMINSARRSHAG